MLSARAYNLQVFLLTMATSYDHVPYPCNAYPQTHPAHLAVVARLQGMQPVDPAQCRYLEIGCGDGGNLLPLAYALPNSHFLGIDLAATSIEMACHHQRAFGQENVEFKVLDIVDLSASELGRWDYIVAHGVFSWVPDPVRLRLLALCRELLSPQGVVFISYNAYPGWHIRNMSREIMLFHTENAPEPEVKISQARALMTFLTQSHGTDDEYGLLQQAEARRILNYAPNHLYHDDLAAINQPYYLYQFAGLAAAHGLQYLGDADYASMFDTRYPAEVRKTLASLGDDPIRQEQYLDFIKCRRFRQTLLCHEGVSLVRSAPLELMQEFCFSSSAKPAASGSGLLDDSPVSFEGEGGLKGETCTPVAKLTLAYLGHNWPGRISFQDLRAAVASAAGAEPEMAVLSAVLREFIEMGAAEAHLEPGCFATVVGERPKASAWALYQQKLGGGVTTLRHHTVLIRDPFGLWLLGQLDGSQSPEEMAHKLAQTVKPDAEGRLDFDKELCEARQLIVEGLQKFLNLGLLCSN